MGNERSWRAGAGSTANQPRTTAGIPGKRARTESLPAREGGRRAPPLAFSLAWYREKIAGPPTHFAQSEKGAQATLPELVGLGFVFRQRSGLWLIHDHPRGHELWWLLDKGADPELEKTRYDALEGHNRTALLLMLDLRRRELAGDPYSTEHQTILYQELETAEALEPSLAASLERAEAACERVRPESREELDELIAQLRVDLDLVQTMRNHCREIAANGGVPPEAPPEPEVPWVPEMPEMPEMPELPVPELPVPELPVPELPEEPEPEQPAPEQPAPEPEQPGPGPTDDAGF